MNESKSKHIFLFSFKWDLKSKKDEENSSLFERTNLNQLKLQINSSVWEEFTFTIKEPFTGDPNPYNEHTYFYDHVRTVLNLKENKEARQFNYKLPKDKKCEYRISILGNTQLQLALEINEILLNFYSSGVGVLAFILTNHTESDFNRILKINEYGRRIYPQFLSASEKNKNGQNTGLTSETKQNFLADKIELTGLSPNTIEETFEHYNTYEDISKLPFVLPKHVSFLLGDKFNTKPYSTLNEGDIKITPIIDDRMFVMSFLYDSALIKDLNKFNEDKKEYGYLNSDKWFRYVFIDDSKPSCTSRIMKRNLLESCTYDRWIGMAGQDETVSGHIFGMSRYSFVILAAKEWVTENLIYVHFSNIYFQVVLLSLVQRASIISYAAEATRIANKIKTDRKLTSKEIEDINSLSQSFLVFKNQIYFREVTAQEQGIEIYNKVHQQMNIGSEVEALEAEIEDLIGFVNTNSEIKRSMEAQKLTRLATWFLPAGVIVGLMSINAYDKDDMIWGGNMNWHVWKWIFFAISISLVFGEILFRFSHIKSMYKYIRGKIIK